jgi:alpha-glucosidase (family GH31 glycosyl hydrolase)
MGREAGAWARDGDIKGDPVGEMLHVVERFGQLDVPHSAIYAEGPSAGNPRLYEGLAGTDIRVLGWHKPCPETGAFTAAAGLKRKDYEHVLLHKKDGSVFIVPPGHFVRGQPYFDFTHPETVKYVRRQFRDWLNRGLAGTMVDDGDDVPVDALFHNGGDGRRMHNRFHYHYHRTFHQVFREVRGDDFVLFARAAGPGCQRFVCFFAGDHPESFDGLESVIYGGLSFAASGFPFWGSDVGGLLARPFQPLTAPVYMRWVAFAAFSPLMRCHGCTAREPWHFGDRAVQVYKHYAWLRMNLLPSIYSLAVEAHRTGVPLMRVGHLPGKGVWTDIWTGEAFRGGRWIERPAGYGREPLFLRQGAILLADLEDRALRWGRSMTPGKRRCVVAAATNHRPSRRTIHLTADRAVEMVSDRDGRAWRLAAEGQWPDVGGFLIYGPKPKRVGWAGRIVEQLDGPAKRASDDPAERWWYDASTQSTKVFVAPAPTGKLPLAQVRGFWSKNGPGDSAKVVRGSKS